MHFALAFIACIFCFAPTMAEAATLTLRIAGVKSDSGVIRLCVFSETKSRPNAYPDCAAGAPVKTANAKIIGGRASVSFNDLPDGNYAVSLFHDADGDGKIGMKTVFGVSTAIPSDGIGISNNPTLYGKPDFKQARFTITGSTSITIMVKYF